MQIALDNVAAEDALAAPVALGLEDYGADALRGSVVNPHFDFVALVSLDELGKLLDVLEDYGSTQVECCFIQGLLVLRRYYEFLSRLQWFHYGVRLLSYEALRRRATMHMHDLQHLVVCILVVLVADGDAEHVTLDIHRFDLVSELVLQHSEFFSVVLLFCRLDFYD